jgi:hypothetical protein
MRGSALIGGVLGGIALGLLLLGFGTRMTSLMPGALPMSGAEVWLSANLGSSVWLFLLVLGAYAVHLGRLNDLLGAAPSIRQVVQLDQLIDVWAHLFVGIGVIWTAIGMRSALQAALSNPDAAFNDTAGDVLQRLVDGGILLALSTTIVGGIGGYLMRLGKTLYLGAALQAFYEDVNHADLRALVATVNRLEAQIATPPVTAKAVTSGPITSERTPQAPPAAAETGSST